MTSGKTIQVKKIDWDNFMKKEFDEARVLNELGIYIQKLRG